MNLVVVFLFGSLVEWYWQQIERKIQNRIATVSHLSPYEHQ